MIAHSKKIGDIEVTALSDGVLATSLDVVLEMDRAEVRRLAGTTDGDGVHIAVNAFLLKLQGRWALIDAGAGNSMGPTLGKLPETLRAFGVAPEEIAAVFLTHIHPDHSNGLVDDAGCVVFANAELILQEAEARSVALPGHTPGHTGWLIASGKASLLIWGDLVHLASVQVARPDTGLVFDVDPQQACATRRRTFDRIAADKLTVAGAHMDFPGFGTIVRKGAGFAFEAEA
jgi:glyoxylase-like metal-dependent hydrolase (beta-lactamase superfamily II)